MVVVVAVHLKPHTSDLSALLLLEEAARAAGKGMWSAKASSDGLRTLKYSNPDDPRAFLERYRGTSLNGVIELVRDGMSHVLRMRIVALL